LWYSNDKYELLVYIGLGLLLLILLYKSYKQSSFNPILSNSLVVSAAVTIIVIPIFYALYRGSKTIFK
jgi:predicted membrane channel-forming protein YqfA (hemolysin III family)